MVTGRGRACTARQQTAAEESAPNSLEISDLRTRISYRTTTSVAVCVENKDSESVNRILRLLLNLANAYASTTRPQAGTKHRPESED